MEASIIKEFSLFALTAIATTISSDFMVDLIIAIITYSAARLFYWAFEKRIKTLILKIKNKLSRKHCV